MATVINNPTPTREVREYHESDSGANGLWIALAVIILAAVLFFAFSRGWFRAAPNTNNSPGINVNVTPPNNSNGSPGNTGNPSGGNSGGSGY